VKEAILRKARESAEVNEQFFQAEADRIEALVRAMAERFTRGGRLYCMGNGGSATDAEHVAVEFGHPIIEKRTPLPAFSLATDTALLTAISNDRDFAKIFADQLRVLAGPDDMALALSTSGHSPNLIQAMEVARDIGLLTIAFAGKDGGRLAELAEHCFVVPSFSIHRIQETHVALYHIVWDLVHVALGADDVI
jgi:D-sedoheptulose 7-phosphate isomerase